MRRFHQPRRRPRIWTRLTPIAWPISSSTFGIERSKSGDRSISVALAATAFRVPLLRRNSLSASFRSATSFSSMIPPSLRQRFLEWHRSLPAFTRDRMFSMSEMEKALKTQGKWLSPVLLELGWKRKRIWSATESYHRVWVPPSSSE